MRYGVDETGKNRSFSDALTRLQEAYGVGKAAGTKGMDADTYNQLRKSLYETEYAPTSFNLGEFQSLLDRLESSKMRQQRQKSVEGRRDIMAGGLAGMMSNF